MSRTTDPQGEMLTEVDSQNNVMGSISRGEAHKKPGVFYRTVYVLVKDGQDRILLQQRSATKDLYPNCWDISVGGHVNFGHSYAETAAREIGEELGVEAMEKDLVFRGEVLVKLPNSGEYFNVFEYNLKPGQIIKASTEEINAICWMTMDEIKKSMADKTLQLIPDRNKL